MAFGVDVKNTRAAQSTAARRDQEILDNARRISPVIAAEAVESEKLGRLSDTAFQALDAAGFFWMWLPEALGGTAVRPTTALEVYETITAADGSAGWVTMAISLNNAAATAFCGAEAVDALFSDRSNPPRLVGMASPRGQATKVDGGYLTSGKYQFGSGAAFANWFIGGVTVTENGKLRSYADGTPIPHVCIVPRKNVIVKNEWNCIGMEGTGSVDYEIPEQLVADGFTYLLVDATVQRGNPMWKCPMIVGYLGHIGIPLGLMKRALAEIAQIARTKRRPGYASVIADDPVFKSQFAMAEANYQAARSYIFELYRTAETAGENGIPVSRELQAHCQQACTWTQLVASDVTRFCQVWGGAEAVREPSALGRAFRNMHVATNHQLNDPLNLVNAVPALLESWQSIHRALQQ
jgi:alkylation response protein AidB-like acyl-CoA dehydrogenase